MEITTHIVLHTKCIEKANKLIFFSLTNTARRNQHTRKKYTLCHKDTIALNDDSLESIIQKYDFL